MQKFVIVARKKLRINKKIKYVKDKKYCREHSRYTGEYGDVAHSICNLK